MFTISIVYWCWCPDAMRAVDKRLSGRGRISGWVGATAADDLSWSTAFAGCLIVLISLAHVLPAWSALNYFDPPKRLLWGALALVLALGSRKGETRLGGATQCLALGLLGWMGLRTLFRPVPMSELDVLFSWMLPLVLFVLGAGLPCRGGRRFLGGCLVLAGGIQAVLMVLQRIGLDPLFAETTAAMAYVPGRMVGTIGYHNQAVDFLALASTAALLLSKSHAVRLGVAAPFFAVACLTGNRGGILAFAFVLLLVQSLFVVRALCSAGHKRRWRAAGAFVLVAATVATVMMLAPETRSRFREVMYGTRNNPAVESRLNMAGIAVDMIREHPWVGAGAGEYALQYLDRLGSRLPEEKNHQILQGVVFAREAHNDSLQFVAEFGFIGLLMAAGLIGLGAVRTKRNFAHDSDAGMAIIYIAAYMAASSLFSFPWQTSMAGPMAGLLLGWWWPEENSNPNPAMDKSGSGGRLLAKWTMVILSLLMVAWYTADLFMSVAVPAALEINPASASDRILHPYAYRYRALIGASLAVQGNMPAAENELHAAHRGYRDLLLWNNLANAYARQGNWEEAAALYERWEACGLDYPNALLNLSIAYEQLGRYGEAAERLSLGRTLFEDRSLSGMKRLAVLYLQAQQPHAARGVLERHRHQWQEADPPTSAEFANLTAAAAIGQGVLDDADYWLRRALELNPELESARSNMALLEELRSRE